MIESCFIRAANENDITAINVLNESEGLDFVASIENTWVAVDVNDNLLGFIRMIMGNNGVMHINPVSTSKDYRGLGIGRMLVEDVVERFGEVRLIARGDTKGFYRALGAREINWTEVDPLAGHNCEGCAIVSSCAPMPMAIKSKGDCI